MLTKNSVVLPEHLRTEHGWEKLPPIPIDPNEGRIESLETQVSELQTEIKTLRAWYNALSNEINRIAPSNRNTKI